VLPGQPVLEEVLDHQQGVVGEHVLSVVNGAVAVEIGGATDGNDIFLMEDGLCAQAGRVDLVAEVVIDAEIEFGEVQAVGVFHRQDAQFDVGVGVAKVGQLAGKPGGGDGRAGGEGELTLIATAALTSGFIGEFAQHAPNHTVIVFPGGSGAQAIRITLEQRTAEVILQTLDLAADGTLGQVELASGLREAAVTGSGLEGAQTLQRREGITGRHASPLSRA